MVWVAVCAAEEKVEAMDKYPVDTCIVSGKKLGSMGDPYVYEHKGRTVQFCCSRCVSKFDSNPEEYLSKLDKMIIEAQLPNYPLDTCVVSGEPLDSMDGPVNKVINNRLVRFCCEDCVEDFLKEPQVFFDILDKGKASDHSTTRQPEQEKSESSHEHHDH